MKMKTQTRIRPVRNPDSGETVYLWQVYSAMKLVGGGYCATKADAASDASIFARSLPR